MCVYTIHALHLLSSTSWIVEPHQTVTEGQEGGGGGGVPQRHGGKNNIEDEAEREKRQAS